MTKLNHYKQPASEKLITGEIGKVRRDNPQITREFTRIGESRRELKGRGQALV